MRDFAFVESSPGRVVVGWGPFLESPQQIEGRTAFYLPDYFLDNVSPWKHPTLCEELPKDEFLKKIAAWLGPNGEAKIAWQTPEQKSYRPLFDSAYSAIKRGDFNKVVPVIFEEGRVHGDRGAFLASLLARLKGIPDTLRIYGTVSAERGLLGASPELLLRTTENGEFETVALAGTRPLERAHELLTDPKELAEHEMVVRDITQRLGSLGEVTSGKPEIFKLPRIAHLRTLIRFKPFTPSTEAFTETLKRLHPTAALGVWPRNDLGLKWLREADRSVKRGLFGAPFGFARADGSGLCVVAIRFVGWRGDRVRVGSGSGVLVGSTFENEWAELANKRAQVKTLFGLPLT